MNDKPTAIERAFQLAKSGRYPSVAGIKSTLLAEGYSSNQTNGTTMRRQLEELIRSAKGMQNAPEALKARSAPRT